MKFLVWEVVFSRIFLVRLRLHGVCFDVPMARVASVGAAFGRSQELADESGSERKQRCFGW